MSGGYGNHGRGMARPGRDLQVEATAAAAVPALISAFEREGFRRISGPGDAPVVLQHGSRGVTFMADMVSEVVPVSLLPSVMHKSFMVRARIHVVEDGAQRCSLRVDAQVLATAVMAAPRFLEALDTAIAALEAQGWGVAVGEITDSRVARS